MILQHNIPALNAMRFNQTNGAKASKNLEKLSSGFQINRAADDASGLAISEKMRGQIRGLNMAASNTEQATNLVQTADGSLQELHNILQRMKELSIQATNGTYQDAVDREALDLELQSLKGEFERIADYTNYNNMKLLDGTLGAISADQLTGDPFDMGSLGALAVFMNQLGCDLDTVADPMRGGVELEVFIPELIGKKVDLIFQPEDLTGEDKVRLAMKVGEKTYVASFVNTGPSPEGVYQFRDDAGNLIAEFRHEEGSFTKNYPLEGGESAILKNLQISSDPLPTVTELLSDNTDSGNNPIPADHPLANAEFVTKDTAAIFQVGANGTADQQVTLHIPNMYSISLGLMHGTEYNPSGTVAQVSVKTLEEARDANLVLEAAIDQVSMVRASLGAMQNRLEFTMNNLGVTSENLQSAESTIRDTDMAYEMMEFTKNSILMQSSQAMLAQANQLPQGVLQLLQ